MGSIPSSNFPLKSLPSTYNKDLQEEIAHGQFRKDLFYRLNLIHLHIPPLRERKDDIVLFVEYFLNSFRKRYAKNITKISNSCKRLLFQHSWPGNIRELKNILEPFKDKPEKVAQLNLDNLIDIDYLIIIKKERGRVNPTHVDRRMVLGRHHPCSPA